LFSTPLYGADVPYSVFDYPSPWNLNNLEGVLNDGLGGMKLKGINTPYLYIGSWKTMFAFHKEDLDFPSINYLHAGKTKFWYCLGRDEGPKLEGFLRRHFSDGFSKCSEFMRHKTTLVNPYLLKKEIPDLVIHK
jgi:[histone H3]-trimethyl-L-lysine9/36 demethylase